MAFFFWLSGRFVAGGTLQKCTFGVIAQLANFLLAIFITAINRAIAMFEVRQKPNPTSEKSRGFFMSQCVKQGLTNPIIQH